MIGIVIDSTGHPEQSIVRVKAFIGSPAMMKIAGYQGQLTVREHLQGLDETRANKLGGRRTHYYGSARRATEYRVEGPAVIINIPQVGLQLHYHGGTVEAGKNPSFVTGEPTKYLTIPATREAYGRTASDFPNLVIVWGRGRKPVGLAIGTPANAGALFSAVSRRHGPVLTKDTRLVPGRVMFWLKKEITLKADPTVLPTEEVLATAIRDRLSLSIKRRFLGQEESSGDFEGGGGI